MQMNLTPVTDALSKEYVYVDNELQDAIKKIWFFSDICKNHRFLMILRLGRSNIFNLKYS